MAKARQVAVIGLGYVGLPVAVAFGRHAPVVGFDINQRRLAELAEGRDLTGEVSAEELRSAKIEYTHKLEDLKKADFFIVAVPTPVDVYHRPDLLLMEKASESVGKIIKKGDIVVFESTVYPGVTEDVCCPIIEKLSGLKMGRDFGLGYSPERINPGDKEHTFTKITKIVAANDAESLQIVADTYGSVLQAGVHKASSIKVAEMAKVIENTQRDVNIALMNEIALICDKIGISTAEVLKAARTKWNFLPFTPGLVGGHCIGVDPYYLTHLCESMLYHPQMILAGRRINDDMARVVSEKCVKLLIHRGSGIRGASINVLGATFKENCPDIRNSKTFDVVRELISYGVDVKIADPLADSRDVEHEYNLKLTPMSELKPADAVIACVPHQELKTNLASHWNRWLKADGVFIDVKGSLDLRPHAPSAAYWSL
jgi:UDP-N-acetyl-D-galactosamine dehydrogenase